MTQRVSPGVDRRSFTLASLSAAAATAVVGANRTAAAEPSDAPQGKSPTIGNGRLKQGFCRWCFNKTDLDQLCQWAKQLGMPGIDLLGPEDFGTLKKHDLVCTMVNSHPLTDGLCDPKHHDMALSKINEAIEAAAANKYRNVICFSGNARGIDREMGMKHCVDALRRIVPVAEKAGVILNMELLNSRVNHPDYMCDRSDWGVELVKQVGSNNFKLLYDIYHMQIMEGDIIRTIQRDHKYFGHYHTAGNPGRHELDDQQELFYPAIARAVAETGFDGYFVHEFIPQRDPLAGLTDAVRQCTV